MAADRQRFDYKVVKLKPGFPEFKERAAEEVLQQLGKEGWELVSAASMGAVSFRHRSVPGARALTAF